MECRKTLIKTSKSHHLALKVFTNDDENCEEVKVYEHLSSVRSDHPDRNYIRNARDAVTINSPDGEHQCLVRASMSETAQVLLRCNPHGRLSEDLLRILLQRLLSALDYLHIEAHLVHTGSYHFK